MLDRRLPLPWGKQSQTVDVGATLIALRRNAAGDRRESGKEAGTWRKWILGGQRQDVERGRLSCRHLGSARYRHLAGGAGLSVHGRQKNE